TSPRGKGIPTRIGSFTRVRPNLSSTCMTASNSREGAPSSTAQVSTAWGANIFTQLNLDFSRLDGEFPRTQNAIEYLQVLFPAVRPFDAAPRLEPELFGLGGV